MRAAFEAAAIAAFACAVCGSVRADPGKSGPEALGPTVPLATPAGGFVGSLTATPAHGPRGTLVHVAGGGFPAGRTLDLVWRTTIGRWKVQNGEYHGRDYTPAAFRIAALTADADGRIAADFVAPEDFGYAHDIVAQQGARLLTQTNFNLDMTWSVSPTHAPLGAPLAVHVEGIGWRELENSWDLVYDDKFVGWVSAVTTHGVADFTIPATGDVGTHVLKLIHGEFTFPYLNPQQNPDPDRPRFAASFQLTPGAAILPPSTSAQTQTQAPRGLPSQGALRVDPPFAPIGAPLVAHAEGLAPNRSYRLTFASMSGNRVGGGGFAAGSRSIAQATADAQGDVAFRFAAPDDLGGPHTIAIDDGATKRQGVFSIVASALPLSVDKGPAGTPFSLHLKGVGWTETANIYTIVYDDNYIGYACGFNSQGDVEVFLNGAGAPGWHYIDAYPAIYKGEESRPNNFRIPQLTFAHDHPGEDLPAFHFAFEVLPQQAQSAVR